MSSGTESKQAMVFRTPQWLRAFVGVAFVLLFGGFVLAAVRDGPTYSTAGLGLFAVLFAAGFADAMTTRVEIGGDALVVVTNFRRRVVPRAEIISVTWEGGSGVALKLASGAHIGLPDVGNSQSRTNSIRAWLKRNDA